jgi:hypothetical protein
MLICILNSKITSCLCERYTERGTMGKASTTAHVAGSRNANDEEHLTA